MSTQAVSAKLKVNMISETTFTVRGHGVHTAFLEMTAGLRQRPDVDIRVNTFRHADIIHIQTIGPYSLAALLFGRGRKVISVHVIPDSFTGSLVGAKYWYGLSALYLRFFYGRASHLLAVSEEVKTSLVGQLKIKRPIDVVFNTVDAAKYHNDAAKKAAARRQLGLVDRDFVVVGVGQVQPRKRYDIFCQLATQLPEYKFYWVGGIPFKHLGADYQQMQGLIDNAPSNLITTGVIELEAVRQYYQAADAFILPSNQENHPLAVLEAAASGLPVVVRDIPEYDSSFGHDVLRGDDSSFAGILQKLATDSSYRQAAVVRSGRIAERFDNPAGAQRLVDIYHQTINERP